jgi:hypothetical protein
MTQETLTKEYPLADVLGVITGYVLVDKGMDGIHSLIEWMAGGGVFTHQIPTVGPYCEKALKRQFAQLNPDNHQLLSWRVEALVKALRNVDVAAASLIWEGLKAQYGDSFQVSPLQPFDEFEQPPLLDGLDKSKTIIIGTSSDDFPENLDA